jgi:uncharacterized protein
MSRLLALGLVLLLALTSARVMAQSLPEPMGYVNDFARVMSSSEVETLDAKLRTFAQQTTAELVVVTVPSLEGMTESDYANRLFERWAVGQKGEDNGLLLLIAPTERRVWMEVGYGLESYIPDGRAPERFLTPLSLSSPLARMERLRIQQWLW